MGTGLMPSSSAGNLDALTLAVTEARASGLHEKVSGYSLLGV